MSLRRKLFLSYALLILGILVGGAWSIYHFRVLGRSVRLIMSNNYRSVLDAQTMKEALERLSAEQRPNLIFTDVVMPGGISGIELAHKVRERFPELPILLTTGYSEQVTGSHGFPVLQKPYEMASLADALQSLLKMPLTAD